MCTISVVPTTPWTVNGIDAMYSDSDYDSDVRSARLDTVAGVALTAATASASAVFFVADLAQYGFEAGVFATVALIGTVWSARRWARARRYADRRLL
jgi:hypothetical protein